jgi:phosphopantetheine adenylyltransferase
MNPSPTTPNPTPPGAHQTARVAYPGSFDPPTVAHLAVAIAARNHIPDASIELVVSRDALGKSASAHGPSLEARLDVLRTVAADHPWLGVTVTEQRFIADIAHGYTAVVVGADKWRQIIDPAWYADEAECERMRARLPRVLVVPRADDDLGDAGLDFEILAIPREFRDVSATAARSGANHLMLPAAARYAERTGHWGTSARR